MTNHPNRNTAQTEAEAEKAAWQAGYDAYVRGESKATCKITDETERAAWNKGWGRAFKIIALY